MRRWGIHLVPSMVLMAVLGLCHERGFAQFGGGSGTGSDPYLISTLRQLDSIRDYTGAVPAGENFLDDTFHLESDLNLTGYSYPGLSLGDNTLGWQPIGHDTNANFGYQGTPFTGRFNGRGHVISNLFIYRTGSGDLRMRYLGLFGRVGPNGEIDSLGLESVNISGTRYVGGLVGESDGTISRSYSTGQVSGGDGVGGLVGRSTGMVDESYSTAQVSGARWVGGLVGRSTDTVRNSYATGSVLGSSSVGGLVGYNNNQGSSGAMISNSYSAGQVSGVTNVGGLLGLNNSNSTVMDSYWNTESSTQMTGIGINHNFDMLPNVVGLMTTQMYMPMATDRFEGWDFTDIWLPPVANDHFPLLRGVSENGQVLTFAPIALRDQNAPSFALSSPTAFEFLSPVTLTGVAASFTSSDDAVATVTESVGVVTVDVVGPGTATITITRAGNADYTSARASQIVTVSAFASGSGTADDPYRINNLNELNSIRGDLLSFDYVLMDDLDFMDVDGAGPGTDPYVYDDPEKGWLPIGHDTQQSSGNYEGTPFTGRFDGNGKVIRNLFIDRPEDDYLGLFGSISGDGRIDSLGLEEVNVRGDWRTGGLVGLNRGGMISYSYSTGLVSGANIVGGLGGSNSGGTISRSYSDVRVSGNRHVGGLLGQNAVGGMVSDCYATGNVLGSESRMSGDVLVHGNVGGLVGLNSSSVGTNSTIIRSYSTGKVSGDSNAGGFVGRNVGAGTIMDSYWHTQISGQVTGVGTRDDSDMTPGVAGLMTDAAYLEGSFGSWDFRDADTPANTPVGTHPWLPPVGTGSKAFPRLRGVRKNAQVLSIVPVAPKRAGEAAFVLGGYTFLSPLTIAGSTTTFSSSDPNVATVNGSTGSVTVVAPGKTVLTVRRTGGDGTTDVYAAVSDTTTLTVNDLATLSLVVRNPMLRSATLAANSDEAGMLHFMVLGAVEDAPTSLSAIQLSGAMVSLAAGVEMPIELTGLTPGTMYTVYGVVVAGTVTATGVKEASFGTLAPTATLTFDPAMNLTTTGATIGVTSTMAGTLRYAVLPADQPSPERIEAFLAVANSVSVPITADTKATITLMGLMLNTSYKVHVVVLDGNGEPLSAIRAGESFRTFAELTLGTDATAITHEAASITVQSTDIGTVHYGALAVGEDVPTTLAEIQRLTGGSRLTIVTAGAAGEQTIMLSGLAISTNYTVYAVLVGSDRRTLLSAITIGPSFMTALLPLSLSTNMHSISKAGGDLTVDVTANVDWTAMLTDVMPVDWLALAAVSPSMGSTSASPTTVTITCSPNTTTSTRTATLTFEGLGVDFVEVLTITQLSGDGVLTISESTHAPLGAGGALTVDVTSNVSWTAMLTDVMPAGWLSLVAVDPSSGNASQTARVVTISYPVNGTTGERTATLTFTGPGATDAVLMITQAAGTPSLSLDLTELRVPRGSGVSSVNVSSGVDWEAMLSEVMPVDWLALTSVVPSSGSASGTPTGVNISYTENMTMPMRTRTATLTFTGVGVAGVAPVVLRIIQLAEDAALTLSESTHAPSKAGEDLMVDVMSNVTWRVSVTASAPTGWLTDAMLSPSVGSADAAVTVNYPANMTTEERTATLTFEGPGATDAVLTVTQEGSDPSITLDESTKSLPNIMGSFMVEVTSNVAWRAELSSVSPAGWLALGGVSPSSGSPSTSAEPVTITYPANMSGIVRMATLTFTGLEASPPTVVLTITQRFEDAELTISPTGMHAIPNTGGILDVSVTSNVNWTVALSAVMPAGWLGDGDVTPASGDASDDPLTVAVAYSDNLMSSPRTATLTFTGEGGGPTATLVLTQAEHEGGVTGLKAEGVEALRLYPNPVAGVFFLQGLERYDRLEVYDLDGRLVHRQSEGLRVDLRHLAAGTYLVRVHIGADVRAVRVLKR